MKSKPVYFYVQRQSSFSDSTITIPYDLAIVNIGNAIVESSGVFTAPVKGRYFFSFSGLVHFTDAGSFWISLMKNGIQQDGSSAVIQPATGESFIPVTLQATLDLLPGNTIAMQITNALNQALVNSELFDSVDPYTHFTGYLLEQDFS